MLYGRVGAAASNHGLDSQGHTPVCRGLSGLAIPDVSHVTALVIPDTNHRRRGVSHVRNGAQEEGT